MEISHLSRTWRYNDLTAGPTYDFLEKYVLAGATSNSQEDAIPRLSRLTHGGFELIAPFVCRTAQSTTPVRYGSP
ncbi:hypothetical protein PM082_012625 [Marasmius tenuissimus]|nr:hypothetical protein PM082_012625 [Marasmius tenuissimus]